MSSSVHGSQRPLEMGGSGAPPLTGGTSFHPLSSGGNNDVANALNGTHPSGPRVPPLIPPKPECLRNRNPEGSRGPERPSLRRQQPIVLDESAPSNQSGTGTGQTGTLPIVPNQGTGVPHGVHFSADTPVGNTSLTLEDATARQEPKEKPANKLAMAGRIAAIGGIAVIYATVWAIPAACLTIGWLLGGVIDKASSEHGGSFDLDGLANTVFKPFVEQGKGLIAASQGYESFSEMQKAANTASQHEALNTTSPSGTAPGSTTPPPVGQAISTPGPLAQPRPGETETHQQRETTSTTDPHVPPPRTDGIQLENKANVSSWVSQNIKEGMSNEHKRAVADVFSHWMKQGDREVTNQILTSLGQLNEVDRKQIVDMIVFRTRTNDERSQILDKLTPTDAKAWQDCGLVDVFIPSISRTPELTLKFYEKFKDYFNSNASASQKFFDEISFKKGNEWQDVRKRAIDLINEDTLRSTMNNRTLISRFVHHGNNQFMELLIGKFPIDHEVWKGPGMLEELFERQLLGSPFPLGAKMIASQLGLQGGTGEIDKDALVKTYIARPWQSRSAPIIGHCIAFASKKQDGGALLRHISKEVSDVQLRNAFEHVDINNYENILQKLNAEDVLRFREMGLAEIMVQSVRRAQGNHESLIRLLEQKFG